MCTRDNQTTNQHPHTMPSPSASPSPQVLEWQRNPSIKHADSIDVELASLDNNASHHKLDQQKRRRKCMLVACGLLFVAAAIGVAIAVASSVTSSKPLVVPEVSAGPPSTPVGWCYKYPALHSPSHPSVVTCVRCVTLFTEVQRVLHRLKWFQRWHPRPVGQPPQDAEQ